MAKYTIEKIKEIIESGEPVFILRARDDIALHAIYRYREECWFRNRYEDHRDEDHRGFLDDFIKNVEERFEEWRQANPDKCKMPD